MNSQEYWRKREEEWQSQQIKDDKTRMAEIKKRLQVTQDAIQKEIAAQWDSFSNGQKITRSEAMKRASEMDIQTFARKAKKYVKDKDFSATANKELKLYNLTMRVNRLELLKANIGLELVAVYDELDKYFSNELTQSGLEELRRQAGVLGMSIPDKEYSKLVKQVVDSSFSNASYSDSLWQYQSELKSDLDKLLVRSVTTGKNPKQIASDLKKYLTAEGKENAKYNAQRLMVTETTRVQIGIQEQSYKDADISEYEYISEPTACHICKPLDGKIFKVKDMKPGLNAPNMHPFCRCSTTPHVDRKAMEAKLKAKELLEEAKKSEPEITNDLKTLASQLGAKLEGLDFRLKTQDSLSRKIRNEPNATMRDVVRYTSISDIKNMVKDFDKTVAELKNRGYNVSAVKNYWNNSSNPYNGINCNFYTPEGYEFELQFHTPESFELKNGKLHELYEKFRVIDPLSEEALKLSKEMQQLSKSLKRPKGISDVKDVK